MYIKCTFSGASAMNIHILMQNSLKSTNKFIIHMYFNIILYFGLFPIVHSKFFQIIDAHMVCFYRYLDTAVRNRQKLFQ